MNAIETARQRVIGAVLNHLSASHDLDMDEIGTYGALASHEMAIDMLDEALATYVKVANG